MATKESAERQRTVRAVWERALRLIPASGRVEDLVESVAASRHRQITLIPFDLGRCDPTGLWVATDSADYVVYPSAAGPTQRAAVVCHELSHMLLGHAAAGERGLADRLAESVAPHVSPEVARRILARHDYDDDAEVEAELLGTRLAVQLAVRADRSRLNGDAISSRLR